MSITPLSDTLFEFVKIWSIIDDELHVTRVGNLINCFKPKVHKDYSYCFDNGEFVCSFFLELKFMLRSPKIKTFFEVLSLLKSFCMFSRKYA